LNEEQIAALYRQWGPVVYRRCLRVLKDRDEAQDATQQVFVKLLRHSDRFTADPSAAIAWMQSVATNVSLNRMRDGRRQSSKLEALHEDTTPASSSPDEVLGNRELAQRVLARVDTPSRDLALSVLVGEQSHEEAAAGLGVSPKTVQRRLRRFIDHARRFLKGGES
jgi:RNA polymerase sigma-70 factor, ECF subfamily